MQSFMTELFHLISSLCKITRHSYYGSNFHFDQIIIPYPNFIGKSVADGYEYHQPSFWNDMDALI
jgi:hypothetical protein